MSGWDFNTKSESTKAEFTKFPVGITNIRIIDSEPHMRWTHWMPKFNRSINCPGKGCPICEIRKQQKANKEDYTYSMGRRFAINVLNKETGKVEIMEQGVGFFQDLKDLMADLKVEGRTLLDVDIKVRRRGTGKDDTSYRLDLGNKSELRNEETALISNKVNMDEFFKPHTNEQILRLLNGESWEDVMKPNAEVIVDEDDSEEIELR